eukprot:2431136-Amphidinium_carterae.1
MSIKHVAAGLAFNAFIPTESEKKTAIADYAISIRTNSTFRGTCAGLYKTFYTHLSEKLRTARNNFWHHANVKNVTQPVNVFEHFTRGNFASRRRAEVLDSR